MRRRMLAAAGAMLVLCGTVRAQDDIEGTLTDVVESELEDQIQDVLEQTVEDAAADVEIDSISDSDLATIDAADFGAELDAVNQLDAADAAVSVEYQSEAGAPVRRGSARDPNRRVVDLLNSGSARVRAAGARSLGNLNAITAVGTLAIALLDRDRTVRRAAADALAKIGSFESLGALRKVLPREPHPQTQRAMDKAIGAIEDRVFAGPGGGQPIVLVCHSCGRKFCLLRRTQRGYCPYDGTLWTLH